MTHSELFSLPLSQRLAVHQILCVSGYTCITGNGDDELTGKLSIMSKNKRNKAGEIKNFLLEQFIKKYKSQKTGGHSWKKSASALSYQDCDAIRILKQDNDKEKSCLSSSVNVFSQK